MRDASGSDWDECIDKREGLLMRPYVAAVKHDHALRMYQGFNTQPGGHPANGHRRRGAPPANARITCSGLKGFVGCHGARRCQQTQLFLRVCERWQKWGARQITSSRRSGFLTLGPWRVHPESRGTPACRWAGMHRNTSYNGPPAMGCAERRCAACKQALTGMGAPSKTGPLFD